MSPARWLRSAALKAGPSRDVGGTLEVETDIIAGRGRTRLWRCHAVSPAPFRHCFLSMFTPQVCENLRDRALARQPWRMRTLFVLPVAVWLAACGGASPRAALVHAPPIVASSVAPSAAPTASAVPAAQLDHALARSAVHAVVSQGLGYFLQRVELYDQPVFLGHRFHGFRIAQLRDQQFWSGVDLKPGDVVTGVNGFPIERPEQAQTAFDSLEVASELRVAYEREGQPHELVYGIVDDR